MSTANKPEKLRVVLDTNVYFSAFTHKGVPFWIWQKAVLREYTLLISPAILREVGEVLRRQAGWSEGEVIRHLKLLVRVGEIVSPAITVQAIKEDDDDNRILECAVAGKADLVVSSDHHLRRLKTYQGIGIVHPVDFRRTLGS
jgi:putative PIN family toxin of toxin-antitoxin system